MKLPVTV